MKKAFIWKYITQHFKDYRIMYSSLILSVIYVCCCIECQSNVHRVLEGTCLSVFAAYFFFLFVTVIPDFLNTKKALKISEESFRLIIIELCDVFSILKVFSRENYQDLQVPNTVQYIKYGKEQTFFNPRTELASDLNVVDKNIYEIHMGRLVLPMELLEDLNIIRKKYKELVDYLNSSYICTDDNAPVDKIGGNDLSDIINDLEKARNSINSYFKFDIKTKHYALMSETEKEKYKKWCADMSLQLPPNKRGNRIYKGGTRIE